MRPVNFRTANEKIIVKSEIRKGKPETILYTRKASTNSITLFKMSFADRIRALLFGRIWVMLVSEDFPEDIHLSSWKSPWLINGKDL